MVCASPFVLYVLCSSCLTAALLRAHRALQKLRRALLDFLRGLLLLLQVLAEEPDRLALAHLLGAGDQAAVAGDLVVLDLPRRAGDQAVADRRVAGGLLHALLPLSDQSDGGVAFDALGALIQQ